MNDTQDYDITEEVNKYFDDSSICKTGKPALVVLCGGICTGKTYIRKQQFSTGYVFIDAAEIFLSLSRGEYFEFGETFDGLLEVIGSLVAQQAVQEKRNIVTEIVGAAEDVVISFLEAMNSVGYTLHLRQIDCDVDEAWQRNVERSIDNISAYYTEPYHLRWLVNAACDKIETLNE